LLHWLLTFFFYHYHHHPYRLNRNSTSHNNGQSSRNILTDRQPTGTLKSNPLLFFVHHVFLWHSFLNSY
jgi:hypothetical protein